MIAETSDQPQLPCGVGLLPLESGRGYLLRTAEVLGYEKPAVFARVVGVEAYPLCNGHDAVRLAHLLRQSADEMHRRMYTYAKGNETRAPAHRMFLGHEIHQRFINISHPRICARCLDESHMRLAEWDLSFATACAVHGCDLIDSCPSCKQRLIWTRAKVSKCACGFDLRKAPFREASHSRFVVAALIRRAIDRAAPINEGEGLEDFRRYLLSLDLPRVLEVVHSYGMSCVPWRRGQKVSRYDKAALGEVCAIVEAAGVALTR